MHVCLYVCMCRLSFHFRSTLPRLSTQFGRPHGAQVQARTLTLKIVPKVCCLEFDTFLYESSTNRVCSKLHRRLCVSNLTHPCSSLPSTTCTYKCTTVVTSCYDIPSKGGQEVSQIIPESCANMYMEHISPIIP